MTGTRRTISGLAAFVVAGAIAVGAPAAAMAAEPPPPPPSGYGKGTGGGGTLSDGSKAAKIGTAVCQGIQIAQGVKEQYQTCSGKLPPAGPDGTMIPDPNIGPDGQLLPGAYEN